MKQGGTFRYRLFSLKMSRRLLVGIFCLFPLLADAEEATPDGFANFAQYNPLGKMRFFTHFGYGYGGAAGPYPYWISAEGLITKDTPREFQEFIDHDVFFQQSRRGELEDGYFDRVMIHSCGGDETAAMRLGDLIHHYDLDVTVAQSGPDRDYNFAAVSDYTKGECRGACMLVAIGGSRDKEVSSWAISADANKDQPAYRDEPYIYLPFFSTPRPIILDYAKARNIDPNLLDRLLPIAPGELRKLTFVQVDKLKIYFEFSDPFSDDPTFQKERVKPCPAAISQIPIAD